MAEEFEGQAVFVGVSNNDTIEDGKAYRDEFDVPYPLAHAPEVWGSFDVPYQPVTILISRKGKIVQRIDGPITYEGLKEQLQRIAA